MQFRHLKSFNKGLQKQ